MLPASSAWRDTRLIADLKDIDIIALRIEAQILQALHGTYP